MKNLLLIISIIAISFSSCKKTSTDNIAPEITVIGSPSVYVDKGTSYVDAGATAWDETDGDITDRIIVNNPVNVNVEAIYYVTYNVSDKAGNQAIEISRKVEVKVF
jgi:hypothetical protein